MDFAGFTGVKLVALVLGDVAIFDQAVQQRRGTCFDFFGVRSRMIRRKQTG